MLEIKDLVAGYGSVEILHGITLNVSEGTITTLVGSNGAGKTTLLQCISGLIPIKSGWIRLKGQDITGLKSNRIVRMGLVQIPEGRELIPQMTVHDNLLLGAVTRKDSVQIAQSREEVFTIFPIIKNRLRQTAGTLSGGEQQMLTIARGLMAKPSMLMLDEPSLGLAPLLVQELFNVVKNLHERGMTILLVEQNVRHSLQLSDYAYVLENGRIVLEGSGESILSDERTKKAYLGM